MKSFLVKIWRANIWFEHFEQCLWVHHDGTDPGKHRRLQRPSPSKLLQGRNHRAGIQVHLDCQRMMNLVNACMISFEYSFSVHLLRLWPWFDVTAAKQNPSLALGCCGEKSCYLSGSTLSFFWFLYPCWGYIDTGQGQSWKSPWKISQRKYPMSRQSSWSWQSCRILGILLSQWP